ncbi:uncharacterized protein [Miscanthus floridulus]|uniref:uncharacterized protein n=1 Tax=Miscanthus floridulus TaxID=154761 RepID=UPI0034577891
MFFRRPPIISLALLCSPRTTGHHHKPDATHARKIQRSERDDIMGQSQGRARAGRAKPETRHATREGEEGEEQRRRRGDITRPQPDATAEEGQRRPPRSLATMDTFFLSHGHQPERWGIERLISMCAQEEERIKSSQGESAHFVKDNKRKNFNGKNSKPQGKPKWDKSSSSSSQGKKPQDSENQQYGGAEKNQCKHCFKKGHYKRDCPDFLKSLLKKGVKWDENLAKRRKND